MRLLVGNWLFGCDVCQDVCPWNRKAPVCEEPGYAPHNEGGTVDLRKLVEMSDAELRESIRGTALERAGLRGLRRNAAVVLGNAASRQAVSALRRLSESPDPVVREAADWALSHSALEPTPPASDARYL